MTSVRSYLPKSKLTLVSLWLWAVAILGAVVGFESTAFSPQTGFAYNRWTDLFIASLMAFLVFGLASGLLLAWEGWRGLRAHDRRAGVACGAAGLVVLGVVGGFIAYLAHVAPRCGCGG